MSKIINCPTHTRAVFDISEFPLIVRWAENILLREKIDAIVACGHSGLILAGALQYAMRIPVFAVRKPSEQPVACNSPLVSGIAPNGKAKRWAWVDDLLSSGGTFNRSRRAVVDAQLVESPIPAAILSYQRSRSESNNWITVNETDIEVWYSKNDADSLPNGVWIEQHAFLD